MAALPEEILFKGVCAYPPCPTPLWICRPCYRGQRYCSDRCYALARREQCRSYNRHYQQGNGRENHKKRQQARRLRQAKARQAGVEKIVTDHSSQPPPWDGNLASGGGHELRHAPDESLEAPKGLRQCRVCGRRSVLVEPLSEWKRVAMLLRRRRGLQRASHRLWSSAMRQPDPPSGSDYVKAILDIYVSLPDTPRRPRREDRYLAQQLHRQGIPRFQVEAALLLATARRVFRDEPHPLAPIRSLRYFVPPIDEVRGCGVDEGYVHYLRDKLSDVLEPKTPDLAARRIRGPKRPRARQLNFPW